MRMQNHHFKPRVACAFFNANALIPGINVGVSQNYIFTQPVKAGVSRQ